MSEQDLTIREMCDAFGVTARTLRFYEAKELIAPRRDGQRRFYGKRDRARLTLILRGKRFGLSLEDIRQLLDLYARDSQNEAQMRRAIEIGQARLDQMKAQRAELDEAIHDLEAELDWGATELARLSRAPDQT